MSSHQDLHDGLGRPVPRSDFTPASMVRLDLVRIYADHARRHFGERLHALLLYGSVARGEAHDRSDIDLLLVIDSLPEGRFARRDQLEACDQQLASPAAALGTELRTQAWTLAEAQRLRPFYFDLTEDAVSLIDRHGSMAAVLDDLRARMGAAGSRRLRFGKVRYWHLVPGRRADERWRL